MTGVVLVPEVVPALAQVPKLVQVPVQLPVPTRVPARVPELVLFREATRPGRSR